MYEASQDRSVAGGEMFITMNDKLQVKVSNIGKQY